MHSIDLIPFVRGGRIFILNGLKAAEDGGTPCQVKLGGRRSIVTALDANHATLHYWGVKGGQAVWLRDIPVPAATNEQGALVFDACAFLKKQGATAFLCSDGDYRQLRNKPPRPKVNTFSHGAVSHEISWGYLSSVCRACFAPGALTLCGQTVRSISWNPSWHGDPDFEPLAPLLHTALSTPHNLTAGQFLQALPTLDESLCSALTIETNVAACSLEFGPELVLTARIGYDFLIDHTVSGLSDAQSLLMQAVGAANRQKLESICAKAMMLGLLHIKREE